MSTWRAAFGRQARSDFELFTRLNSEHAPMCHQLHYLQMATEKLAKAFLIPRASGTPPKPVHSALVKFVRHAKTMPDVRRAFGLKPGPWQKCMDGLGPMAEAIEELAPSATTRHPNPEYPWNQHGQIVAPADYAFPSIQWESPQLRKMLLLVKICLKLV